jgi:hypothetical protein
LHPETVNQRQIAVEWLERPLPQYVSWCFAPVEVDRAARLDDTGAAMRCVGATPGAVFTQN